jgi:hypothetical protein
MRTSLPIPLSSLLLLAVPLTACARTDPCPHTTACPPPSVCGADGTCRPMARTESLRFAGTGHLRALEWAIQHGTGAPNPDAQGDTLRLGGPNDAIAHLAFGPLSPEVPVAQAILTLFPHPSFTGADHPWRVAVVLGRAPSSIRAGRRPELGWMPPVRVVRVRAGGPRPLRVDVTPLVQAAMDAEEPRVLVGLRTMDRKAPELRYASPNAADPGLRPRLDLVPR